MNAREIARALGGVRNGRGWLCRCPVPSHGQGRDDRTPSLSIADGDGGKLLVKCFSGCDTRDVLAELRARGLLTGRDHGRRPERRPPPTTPPARPDDEERRRIEAARRIWAETRPAPGTLTDAYLAGRGIQFAIPADIRHHNRLVHYQDGIAIGFWPAMVVRLTDPAGDFVGIQALWLDPAIEREGDGKARVRAPRKILGKAGVAWFAPRDAEAIAVGEGVESALAARELAPWPVPAWGCCHVPDVDHPHEPVADPPEPYGLTAVAAISAASLAQFDPPATVR